MLELPDNTEVEVPNEMYIKIKIESAAMLLRAAATIVDEPEVCREFVSAAESSLNHASQALWNER